MHQRKPGYATRGVISPSKFIYFNSPLNFELKFVGLMLVQMTTLKILALFNLGGFSLIFVCSYFLTKGSNRVRLLGWIGLSFGVGVFVAPLSIMVRILLANHVATRK